MHLEIEMAVPKKKTSPARRGNRRSHDKLKRLNIIFDSKTGEPRLSHMMSADGKYNGVQVQKRTQKSAVSE